MLLTSIIERRRRNAGKECGERRQILTRRCSAWKPNNGELVLLLGMQIRSREMVTYFDAYCNINRL